MNSSFTRRWRNTLAITAIAALTAIGFASPAAAAPTIDPGATGSLTIHKRVNPAGVLTPGNGLEDPAAPGGPLAGISFDLQSIGNVDLMTTAGWSAAGAFAKDPGTIPAADLGTAVSGTTTEPDGTYTFGGLPVGAYLVTEQLTPAQIDSGITGAAPFVVTIPITDPDNLDNWVYNVHVYPKNHQTSPTKTVDDGPGSTYQVGDLINWTISAQVPAQATDAYAFKDELVAHLEIPANVGDNISVAIGGTALDPADYKFGYDAASDNILLVELEASGLAKLNAVTGNGQDIALTITTKVVSLPENGIIENEGIVFPNSGYPISGPGVVTPPVESKFGAINILKVDAADGTKFLAGAEFKVFKSEADARAFAADPVSNASLPLKAQENGAGALVDTFTTGTNGEVSIFGLRASNWQDGAEVSDPADFQNYWLLETKAPQGYELATAPFGPITVKYDNAAPTVLPFGDLDVPNVEKTELPLTGGTIATGIFFLAGALILGGISLLVVRSRKRGAMA